MSKFLTKLLAGTLLTFALLLYQHNYAQSNTLEHQKVKKLTLTDALEKVTKTFGTRFFF